MAQSGPTEAELVRAIVTGPVGAAERDALAAQGRADGRAPALFDNPSLEVRHEDARGPAGSVTDAVGLRLGVDLGVAGASAARAAGLRGRATELDVRSHAVQAVCQARADVLDLWAAERQAQAVDRAHGRLAEVLGGLRGLADAGDLSGYDRDRLALSVAAHLGERDRLVMASLDAQERLGARAGRVAEGVRLAERPTGTPAVDVDEVLAADAVLAGLRLRRDAALADRAAARRSALPTLELSGGARWDALEGGAGRTGGFEVGAGLELPVFERAQVERAEADVLLADVDAEIARREALVRQRVAGAVRQLEALQAPVPSVDAETLWQGVQARWAAGEAPTEELLAVAEDIEAAEAAAVQSEVLRREARLELACIEGTFPEPEFQDLLEELIR